MYEYGDKVVFINEKAHNEQPGFYPPVGTIGTVTEYSEVFDINPFKEPHKYIRVVWPTGTVSGPYEWECDVESVKPYDISLDKQDYSWQKAEYQEKEAHAKVLLEYLKGGNPAPAFEEQYRKEAELINNILHKLNIYVDWSMVHW